jgi:CRISPR-associated endonuclease Cas3-HD
MHKWPLAYAKCNGRSLKAIPLRDHLKLTASLSTCLLAERFKQLRGILNRDLIKLRDVVDLEELVYMIGLLHDLGKASIQYYEVFAKQVKSSQSLVELRFHGHEHIISCLIETLTLLEREDEVFIAVCDLLAKVISRHHSAMEERHPLRFTPRPDFMKIVNGMCNNIVTNFIEKELLGVCNEKNYKLCTRILKSLIRHIENKHLCEQTTWFECKRGIQSFSLSVLTSSFNDQGLRGVYKLVSALTGILIISDNLAADYEGRASDEGSSRLYVAHWKRELSDYLKKCLRD